MAEHSSNVMCREKPRNPGQLLYYLWLQNNQSKTRAILVSADVPVAHTFAINGQPSSRLHFFHKNQIFFSVEARCSYRCPNDCSYEKDEAQCS